MFVSGWKWKTRKTIIHSPIPTVLWIVSVSQGKYQYKKKRRKRKKKNTDTTQTKLYAPHVRYNVKILPQQLIIGDKKISEQSFERKLLGVVSRFSTDKSLKNLRRHMLFKRKMQVTNWRYFFSIKSKRTFLR